MDRDKLGLKGVLSFMSAVTSLKPEKTDTRQQRTGTPAITTNPKRMGGEPVIGTERMPVTTLLDFLIGGESISEFSEVYGTPEEACKAALQVLRDAIDEGKLTDLIAQRVDY
jgi:uncharacterized protein (DUF433 family)